MRTRILTAASDLLARSADGDVSTRAVCAAAGVAAPALYRQFGDKEGLLRAVVDDGFEQYLAAKRALRQSADPVRDLHEGWDGHLDFALEHRNVYRLMYAPGLTSTPAAAVEAHQLLVRVLERCATAGRLKVEPGTAAPMIMSANVGIALSLILRPELYPDRAIATRVRDAVFAAVLDEPPGAAPEEAPGGGLPAAAITLRSLLRAQPPGEASLLSSAEQRLLQEWLGRLTEGTPS